MEKKYLASISAVLLILINDGDGVDGGDQTAGVRLSRIGSVSAQQATKLGSTTKSSSSPSTS